MGASSPVASAKAMSVATSASSPGDSPPSASSSSLVCSVSSSACGCAQTLKTFNATHLGLRLLYQTSNAHRRLHQGVGPCTGGAVLLLWLHASGACSCELDEARVRRAQSWCRHKAVVGKTQWAIPRSVRQRGVPQKVDYQRADYQRGDYLKARHLVLFAIAGKRRRVGAAVHSATLSNDTDIRRFQGRSRGCRTESNGELILEAHEPHGRHKRADCNLPPLPFRVKGLGLTLSRYCR